MQERGKSHARLLELASLAGVVGFAFFLFCFWSSITRGPSEAWRADNGKGGGKGEGASGQQRLIYMHICSRTVLHYSVLPSNNASLYTSLDLNFKNDFAIYRTNPR